MAYKALVTKNFLDGATIMTNEDDQNAASIVNSELYQKEFCKYILHTSEWIIQEVNSYTYGAPRAV